LPKKRVGSSRDAAAALFQIEPRVDNPARQVYLRRAGAWCIFWHGEPLPPAKPTARGRQHNQGIAGIMAFRFTIFVNALLWGIQAPIWYFYTQNTVMTILAGGVAVGTVVFWRRLEEFYKG